MLAETSFQPPPGGGPLPDNPQQKINWQPISMLPLIGSIIEDFLDEVEKQYENLQACRPKSHVLDNYTLNRLIDLYTAQSDDLDLFEEQLSRWKNLNLIPIAGAEQHGC